MSLTKKLLTLAAPVALLALGACSTGFSSQVTRFQALPAPEGQTFVVVPAREQDRGGLEFRQYADLVRAHMLQLGYTDAVPGQGASLIVTLDYGVDSGREVVRSYPGYGGYGGFGYPFYGHYGHYGFYRGFYDPFWYGGGFGYSDVYSYTVFTSFLDLDIKRAADGQALFEGLAKARSRSDELPVLVPNLVTAMFTGFPGNNGETVKITIPPQDRQAVASAY